uniref:Sodium-dependent dopamine transporter n=1 Tax=Timema cristinae TaxID=61476 RepID=A0A7R9CHF1_TIMCR|nr:unnamed protein product [Timema cristinae]
MRQIARRAFLVPYSIMLVVGGIPLFYMELALGQFNRKGAITCWGRLVPLFKGIGYAVALIAFYVDFYYNVIIAWALRLLLRLFHQQPAVDHLRQLLEHAALSWNTPHCKEVGVHKPPATTFGTRLPVRMQVSSKHLQLFRRLRGHVLFVSDQLKIIAWDSEDAERDNSSVIIEPYTLDATATSQHHATNLSDTPFNSSRYTSPASEYFKRQFLPKDVVDRCMQVVWFTALFPYAVLLILLVRGVTLPGSAEGIRYYLSPNFDAITKAEVWVDAATQVFFSLGPGFGVLLAYASYNKYHNNVYKDALVTSVINSCTSFIAGIVIFSVLGYMAHASGRHIKDVATEGPGLVFIVYPAAIATMPGSIFWALIFFMMLLTLGLDSSFGGSEAIITALSDEFPIIGHNREIFVACLFTLYFLVGLTSCSQGGFYFFHLLDRYAAGYSMLFAVLFETIAVSWIYGNYSPIFIDRAFLSDRTIDLYNITG